MSSKDKPYQILGKQLKNFRVVANRSIEEVSGAVEIDEIQLKQFEAGLKRPTEDIMLLLISYFNVEDKQAHQLWQLANYESDISEHLDLNEVTSSSEELTQMVAKPMLMILSMDVRTMYSDGIEISWNESGFTLNFTQSVSGKNKNQSTTVARVGMSQNQAENVLKTLESALLRAKYVNNKKLLPPSTDNKK
jgi:transcriptional regulator with XRE-family HTH domain